MEFSTKPDYECCREFFRAGLRKRHLSLDGKLIFDDKDTEKSKKTKPMTPVKRKSPSKSAKQIGTSNDVKKKTTKRPLIKRSSSVPKRRVEAVIEEDNDLVIKKKTKVAYKESASQTSPAFVEAVRRARRGATTKTTELGDAQNATNCTKPAKEHKATTDKVRLENPTPAMQELMNKRSKRCT